MRIVDVSFDGAAGALAACRDDTAAERGLTVTADLGAAIALGDSELAERLVANLTDNAIRCNEPGGRVEITAGTRDGRPVLAVANNGPVPAGPPDLTGSGRTERAEVLA
jgi:signal transduction histidine kinase